MKRITTIEELVSCASSGVRVSCPEVTYFEKPMDANKLMNFSSNSLLAA